MPAISPRIKPIISVKEARKILGLSTNEITDEELYELLLQQEQIVRFILRKNNVHKNKVV